MELKYSHGARSGLVKMESKALLAAAIEGSVPELSVEPGSNIEAAAHASEMSVKNGHCISATDILTSTATVPSFSNAIVACAITYISTP